MDLQEADGETRVLFRSIMKCFGSTLKDELECMLGDFFDIDSEILTSASLIARSGNGQVKRSKRNGNSGSCFKL